MGLVFHGYESSQPVSGIMRFSYVRQQLSLFATHHRLGIAFIGTALGIIALDFLAQGILAAWESTGSNVSSLLTMDIGFAPEVWLSVIGLTLGTLVIVISIAAQTIPKVADLYMQDWVSLGYIWFVIGGSTHSACLKVLQDNGVVVPASLLLNMLFLLPLAVILAFPYIFYVLRNIQPDNVIQIILRRHLALLRRLPRPTIQTALMSPDYQTSLHQLLFDALTQLESIFSYVTFKEPKAQIIQAIEELLQEYVKIKPLLGARFFEISAAIRKDLAFQTMASQFSAIEQSRTFYEQKCFRVLGNAYLQLLEEQDFDLASLCGAQLSQIGLTAIQAGDDNLVDITIIRMNTLIRFALKHGIAHNEARHLYNLVCHYGELIESFIDFDRQQRSQECIFYLRTHGNEVYQQGRSSPTLLFIVYVVAAEIRSLLIKAHEAHWPQEIQRSLLMEMLQVDNPPEIDPTSLDPKLKNNGVRMIQISLALYYLKMDATSYVDLITSDLLDDVEVLESTVFLEVIHRICDRLQSMKPTYWEATDRSNRNLFYSSRNLFYSADTDQIPAFLDCLKQKM